MGFSFGVVGAKRIEGHQQGDEGRDGSGEACKGRDGQRAVKGKDGGMGGGVKGGGEFHHQGAITNGQEARRHGWNGASIRPWADRPSRKLRAMATAPGLSPWMQMD